MDNTNFSPPSDTLRVFGWQDLPSAGQLATYAFTMPDGEQRHIMLEGKHKQVLEGLMHVPIYCASIARVSHYVCELKKLYGLDILTEWYSGRKDGQSYRFGVYFLRSEVVRREVFH